jgi:hypothetical protein
MLAKLHSLMQYAHDKDAGIDLSTGTGMGFVLEA